MPYKSKKTYKTANKKRKMYKKSNTFTKKQVNTIKTLALKSVNKTRELKFRNVQVDEYQVLLNSSGVVTTNLTNNYLFNYLSSGTASSQRTGTQVNPVSLHLRGWAKINGDTNDASFREIKSRVIMGYVDNDSLQDLESSLSSSLVFWNGEPEIPTGDYKDVIRKLNYKFINPIYDRTFTIAPNMYQQDGNNVPTTFIGSKLKDYYNININKKFGKNSEIRWDSINNDCWQKQNLVMLVFNRLMNDDTVLTTIPLEFCLEGGFYFHDA